MPGHDTGQARLPLLGALLPHLIRRGELTIIALSDVMRAAEQAGLWITAMRYR